MVINAWFNLSKTVLGNENIKKMFASTLVMDGKVAVTERQYMGINTVAVPACSEAGRSGT